MQYLPPEPRQEYRQALIETRAQVMKELMAHILIR
jgi:hypothetical protein